MFAYKNAAQNAKQAGFDGVECELSLHCPQQGRRSKSARGLAVQAGGGYLPHQFLDSSSNKRTDQWGGNAEKRSRFVIEIVRALIEVWGCDRVGVKLSPTGGLNDVGMALQDTIDTYTFLIKRLDSLKVIYITLVRYVEAQDPKIEGCIFPLFFFSVPAASDADKNPHVHQVTVGEHRTMFSKCIVNTFTDHTSSSTRVSLCLKPKTCCAEGSSML